MGRCSTGRNRCSTGVNYAGSKKDGDLRRSEEHTSELQSQSNLVCRLLLEKKKKNEDSLLSHFCRGYLTAEPYLRVLLIIRDEQQRKLSVGRRDTLRVQHLQACTSVLVAST